MLFLSDYITFTDEDYNYNTLALTWYEKIQPIYLQTEVSLFNSKENWIKKLKSRTVRTKTRLQEYHQKLNAFKQNDRFSEAETCVHELEKMTKEINEFHHLVSIRNILN